ncbi:MAG: hypothetical protein RI900_1075 [Actinomycetota bacterium]
MTRRNPTARTAEGREFIGLVTALMATMALGIDLMLPAFPEMRQEFGFPADSTTVSWVITAYFLGVAIGPWLYGPASDRYGRRKPLFAGLTLYAIGALVASVAPTWPLVVAARFVWGLGAAGPRSLAVTMVRDRHEGDTMARLMSMIMAVFMLVPIVAPAVGSALMSVFPWRAVFWFPAVLAGALMLWARRLPETHPPERRRPFTWSAVRAAGREVVTHRTTMALTGAMTLLFGVMTTYLSGLEVVVEDVYGYGPWFPLVFGVIAVLFAANSLNNARMVQRVGAERLVRRLSAGAAAAALALAAVGVLGGDPPNFWLFIAALCITMTLAQGTTPTANTIAMTPLPHVAGTASAIISTCTTAGGSLLGSVSSSAFDGTVRPIALAMFVYLTLAAVLVRWGTAERHDRAQPYQ